MIELSTEVLVCCFERDDINKFLTLLENYTEFPHLKRFKCDNNELLVAILAKSQLKFLETKIFEAILPKLADQTQLKEI